MIEFPPDTYLHITYLMIITIIGVFLLVLFTLRRSDQTEELSIYYLIYFTVALAGWVVLWGVSTGWLAPTFRYNIAAHIAASTLLYFGIKATAPLNSADKGIIAATTLLLILNQFIESERIRLTMMAVFNLALYPAVSWQAFKLLSKNQSVGTALILVSVFSYSVASAVQVFIVLFSSNWPLASAVALGSTALSFILTGIGILADQVSAHQAQLRELTLKDPLTNLINRRGLGIVLKRQVRDQKPPLTCISAIVLDIDHFKKVNDTYGHDAGDKVIAAFARAILEGSREQDICSRLGGEEFAIILPGTAQDQALIIAERYRQVIENLTIDYDGQILKITASLGVSGNCDLHDIDLLLKTADKALYAAKSDGRNCVRSESVANSAPA